MKIRLEFLAGAIAGLAGLSALIGCAGSPPPIQPVTIPQNAPLPRQEVTAPPQTQLEPPPPPPAPPPQPAKRVVVCVTERAAQAETSRRDPESEAILAEALLAVAPELNFEIVRKGTYEEILERDFESLIQKGFDESAQVFTNLLKAGVDLVALGEVGISELSRDLGQGKTISERFHVHAGVQLVRTDSAQVLAASNADADEKALRDAKTKSLGEASRKIAETVRTLPKGAASPLAVTITVDGLADFAQAEAIGKKLREIPGVLWSRDLRFSAAAPGAPGGVARYEIGWNGTNEALRERIQKLDAGVRLEVTRIEGNRWNYRAAGKPAVDAPAPPPAPPAPPPEKPAAEKK